MRDKYPRVTRTQVDLWLQDPVTKALAQCLEWCEGDVKDEINTGSCIDESNADLTLSRLSKRRGQIEGLVSAGGFENMFSRYEMIEVDANV